MANARFLLIAGIGGRENRYYLRIACFDVSGSVEKCKLGWWSSMYLKEDWLKWTLGTLTYKASSCMMEYDQGNNRYRRNCPFVRNGCKHKMREKLWYYHCLSVSRSIEVQLQNCVGVRRYTFWIGEGCLHTLQLIQRIEEENLFSECMLPFNLWTRRVTAAILPSTIALLPSS